MTKNLKISFILALIFSGVVIAWRSLMGFMGAGVGLNFVALLVLTSILLVVLLTDSYVKSRFFDIFILTCIFTGLEFLIYFIFEFNIGSTGVKDVFFVFQNIFSVLGILFFAYLIFRFVIEVKQIRLSFVEALLGNTKSRKKSKELANGSLEDKPSSQPAEEVDKEPQKEEIVVENSEQ